MLSDFVITQSPDWIALDKPAGVLSVPGRLVNDSALSWVRESHDQAYAVHRLDQATSGILLIALNQRAARALGLQFQSRLVHKRYEAVVAGKIQGKPTGQHSDQDVRHQELQLENQNGEINAPLIADWPNRPMQKIDFATGKPSLTLWRLQHYDVASDTSRVSLTPVTGRSHQLRVHMQHIGNPVVGDTLYGGTLAPRLMLHASELNFTDPSAGQVVALRSCVPF